METYEVQKREATGIYLPPCLPVRLGQIYNMLNNLMHKHADYADHTDYGDYGDFSIEQCWDGEPFINVEDLLKEEFGEQAKLRDMLEFRWDTEFATDRKAARMNLEKLRECLLTGDYAGTSQLFIQKPAADWLNYVFLNETEVNDLLVIIKNTTTACKNLVSVAITKEIDRLLIFKALFMLIKKISQERIY